VFVWEAAFGAGAACTQSTIACERILHLLAQEGRSEVDGFSGTPELDTVGNCIMLVAELVDEATEIEFVVTTFWIFAVGEDMIWENDGCIEEVWRIEDAWADWAETTLLPSRTKSKPTTKWSKETSLIMHQRASSGKLTQKCSSKILLPKREEIEKQESPQSTSRIPPLNTAIPTHASISQKAISLPEWRKGRNKPSPPS
jgi:hypothetical protein